jgi:RNA polymerase sigma-70 factor (ECF subfamily)
MNEKNKKELMILMPKLRRYCYALTNDKESGDDLLHDSIVKILAKFDFLKIDNFQAYIYRLISNTWKDNLRKKYTRNEISITSKNIENDPALSIKNDDNLDYISTKDSVFEKINNLSEKLKETLILVTVQKKSYKETADILKVPIGTIMSRIHEARRILTEANNEFNKEKRL